MPSHIAHLLFAEEATRRFVVDSNQLLSEAGNALRLGAQGPDLFYHSLRTKPRGFRFGPLMHRIRFGSLVNSFLDNAISNTETTAFALGLATHAALDRRWHPYIVYHAGWVAPEKPETSRLSRCHAFLERVLDVLLAEKLGIDAYRIDFFSNVYLGEELPKSIRDALVEAIAQVYPRLHDPMDTTARVINAYRDSLRFYTITDARNPRFRQHAQNLERNESSGRRRLAIFHPIVVDRTVDWANESNRHWRHPCDPKDISTDSIFDLFDQALDDVAPMLRAILRTTQTDCIDAEVAKSIGDHSLNLSRNGLPCAPTIADPLPIADLLDEQYEK